MCKTVFFKGKSSKITVKKWIDTPNLKENEKFISDWHYFILDLQERFQRIPDDEMIKKINMLVLQYFFLEKYDSEHDFYPQFQKRLEEMKKIIGSFS